MKAIQAGLVAALGLLALDADATKFSVTILPSADGKIHSSHPGGDYTPPATLTVDCTGFPSLTPLYTGSAFSQSITGYASGSGAAGSTKTVETVSGDNAATNGWSISSGNLVNPGSNPGSGQLRVKYDAGGGVVAYCGPYSWQYVAPPSVDTTAPTVPTGFRSTTVGVGSVTVTHDASRDPYNNVAGAPGTGLAQYNYKLNGSVVATQVAQVGLNAPLAETVIGTVSTHSCTPSGANLTITASGAGMGQGTADGFTACGNSFTGPGHAIAQVTGLSSASSFPKAGVGVRASTAADSAGYAIYAMGTLGASTTLQVRGRPTTGASAANIATATAACANPYTKAERSADVATPNLFTFGYSCDGGAWTDMATWTDSTAAPFYYAGGTSTDEDGSPTTATATFAQVNINNTPPITKTIDTACTTCAWSVNAQDAQTPTPNASAYTTHTVSAVPTAPAANAIKWHPGNYVMLPPATGLRAGDTAKYSTIRSLISSQICPDSHIDGIAIMFYWGALESTQGNYSGGFGLVDTLLNDLKNCSSGPKRLIIRMTHASFGSPPTSQSTCSQLSNKYPQYVCDAGYVVQAPNNVSWSGGYQSGVRVWEAGAMDRVIALSNAYGARYGGTSTAQPYPYLVEAFFPQWESAESAETGFTHSAYLAQVTRLYATTEDAWPNTMVNFGINWAAGGDAAMKQLIDVARNSNSMFGGPDSIDGAHRAITSNFVYRGCRTPASPYLDASCTPGSTYTDLRGMYGWVAEYEYFDLPGGQFCVANSGVIANCTLASLQAYAHNIMRATHILWTYNDWSGTAAGQWAAQKAFIDAGSSYPYNNGTTPCPSAFTGGCQ